MKSALLILLLPVFLLAKTSVQIQSLELKAVSSTHSVIQLCTEVECESIGSKQGYTKFEINQMFVMNSQVIKKLNYEKWFVGIAASLLSSYLFKWGKVLTSITVGLVSLPQMKSWDEKIEVQKALEQRPQLLSDGSYELTPEAFSLVKEGLINAVEVLENCLSLNERYYGTRGFEYCQTGRIPDPAQTSIFYGYP